ncbi:MAG TPA: YtpI family protein [Bacillota bacterium]|nr:YtpI family protein [Bacillota bacterium]
MIIFTLLIVFSIVFYVYYKVAILKTKDPLTQAYYNAKSRLALGAFIIAFAINQYLFYQSKLSLVIGLIFFILGFLQINLGFKEARHYKKEYRRLNNM